MDDPSFPAKGKFFLKPPFKIAALLVVAIILIALSYLIYTIFSGSSGEREPVLAENVPFSLPVILSLEMPIKDKEGIPFAGVVQYDPASNTYSYIAAVEEGEVQPIGSASFSSGPYYLAIHQTASTSDLVIYDRVDYEIERIVRSLPPGSMVPFVAWSATGDTFAYMIAGGDDPAITIESVDGSAEVRTIELQMPIGFSADGSKLLTRSVPNLGIVDTQTGERTLTVDTAFANMQTKFLLSPGGEHLVTLSEKELEWYTVDWETGSIIHAGNIVAIAEFTDVLFLDEQTLLVREVDNNVVYLYGRQEDGSVGLNSFSELVVPDGAHLLNVVTQ